MRQAITDGRWFEVATEAQHNNLKSYGDLVPNEFRTARVEMGKYTGPGWYLLLSYQQRCPRNCCYDSVYEVLNSQEVERECKEQMRELADTLKKARS